MIKKKKKNLTDTLKTKTEPLSMPALSEDLINALDEDGLTPAANIRMEAAKQILDRVGIVKREKVDINAQVAHGIFILPPKDAQT